MWSTHSRWNPARKNHDTATLPTCVHCLPGNCCIRSFSMLLEIAQWLAKDFRLFNVFNYITLRAVL
ncbi:MAG TPA: hypothetical protein VK642_12780, partial [Burkholderiales bacterium]|nr:hypothetical protein [Burkholderiales bacterium]